jgi:hypothetical protein
MVNVVLLCLAPWLHHWWLPGQAGVQVRNLQNRVPCHCLPGAKKPLRKPVTRTTRGFLTLHASSVARMSFPAADASFKTDCKAPSVPSATPLKPQLVFCVDSRLSSDPYLQPRVAPFLCCPLQCHANVAEKKCCCLQPPQVYIRSFVWLLPPAPSTPFLCLLMPRVP